MTILCLVFAGLESYFTQGIDAEYVSLENIVPEGLEDGEHGASKDWSTETLDQEFYDRLAVILGERIAQCEHRVPVVTGMSVSDPDVSPSPCFRIFRTRPRISIAASGSRIY